MKYKKLYIACAIIVLVCVSVIIMVNILTKDSRLQEQSAKEECYSIYKEKIQELINSDSSIDSCEVAPDSIKVVLVAKYVSEIPDDKLLNTIDMYPLFIKDKAVSSGYLTYQHKIKCYVYDTDNSNLGEYTIKE